MERRAEQNEGQLVEDLHVDTNKVSILECALSVDIVLAIMLCMLSTPDCIITKHHRLLKVTIEWQGAVGLLFSVENAVGLKCLNTNSTNRESVRGKTIILAFPILL